MHFGKIAVLTVVLVTRLWATQCVSYAEQSTSGGGGGFNGYIRVAAPHGANINLFVAEARVADSDMNAHPWTVCPRGQQCYPTGPNSGRVTFQTITEYGFPPPEGWSEPNVQRAYIGTIQSLDNVAMSFRYSIKYSWNKPYCEALAWNRMEHNTGWPVIRVMVPAKAKITGFGGRVRDGDNGAQWFECPTNGTICPIPEFMYEKFVRVEDAGHSMQGYQTTTLNGSSARVRNAEVWVRYEPAKEKKPTDKKRATMPTKKKSS